MLFSQWLFTSYNLCQVSIHQLSYYIYIIEMLPRFRKNDGLDVDYIVVFKESKKTQLTQNSLRKCFMIEYFINFLNCHKLLRWIMSLFIFNCNNNTG